MAAALPAMQVAGGAISAEGALVKGRMTSNSLNAQAMLEDAQAKEATQAGEYNAFRHGLKSDQILGHATAAYGASGVASGSTSEQSVLMAGAINSELDRQNILHGAELRSLNYKNQANLNRFGANSALEGSYFAALGNLLGSSGGFASSFATPGSDGGVSSMPSGGSVTAVDSGLPAGATDLAGPEGVPIA